MIVEITNLSSRFGPPRNQGDRPTCLAFASSDLNQLLNEHDVELSVEYLLHHAGKNIPGWSPKDGLTVPSAVAALRQPGQPEENSYPYQANNHDFPTQIPGAFSPLYCANCVQLNLSIDQIEAAVRGGNAVCIGVAMSDKFFVPVDGIVNDSVNYIPGMGHAVLAVGIGVHQASKQTYFLIRNSWGPNWGINGHAWLSREYLSNYLRASFAA